MDTTKTGLTEPPTRTHPLTLPPAPHPPSLSPFSILPPSCYSHSPTRSPHPLLQRVLSANLVAEMPRDCPFHPDQDMYLDQEKHKAMVRRSHLKCGYCGKQFRDEHYIDRHMDRRHEDKITEGASVCLADFCDVLDCTGRDHPSHPLPCKPDLMAQRKFHCGAIFHKCFPPGRSAAMGRAHDRLLEEVCGRLTCIEGRGAPRAGTSSQGWPILRLVGICVLLVGMAAFYIIFYFQRSEMRGRSDLRRLKTTSHAPAPTGISSFLLRQRKAKLI